MQSSGAVFEKNLDELSEQLSISIDPEKSRRIIHWCVDSGGLFLIDVHRGAGLSMIDHTSITPC